MRGTDLKNSIKRRNADLKTDIEGGFNNNKYFIYQFGTSNYDFILDLCLPGFSDFRYFGFQDFQISELWVSRFWVSQISDILGSRIFRFQNFACLEFYIPIWNF